MPSSKKKNYNVDAATADDIDEIVRKHVSHNSDGKVTSDEDGGNQCE